MQTPKSTDDLQEQALFNELAAWAKKAGYDIDKAETLTMPTLPSAPQTTPPRPAQAPRGGITRKTRAAGGLNFQASKPPPIEIDLKSPKGVALKRAFKGGEDKKTCLLEIGGSPWVVKGGSGNEEDHVAASDLIRQMGLKGVAVPRTRVLDDSEKAAIAKTLATTGNPDALELSKSLLIADKTSGKTSGLVSELGAGKALDGLMPSTQLAKQDADALALRAEIQDMPVDAAWGKVFVMVAKTLKPAFTSAQPELENWKTTTDAAERKKALAWLATAQNLGYNTARRIPILDEIDKGTVKASLQQRTQQAKDQEAAAMPLKSFAQSPQGVEAFAGVAVGDLVCGMDDRLLGKHNGGNFIFDAANGTLNCIDNHKEPGKSLAAKDQKKWAEFMKAQNISTKTTSLVDALFARVYEAEDASNAWVPGNYVKFTDKEKAAAKAKFQEVLGTAIAAVESNPEAPQAAQDRVAYLKARLALESCFTVEPSLAEPPDLPAKIGKTEKLGRMLSLSSKRRRDATQKIKDELRAGTLTAEDAKQRLLALQAESNSLATDRRSAKIEFLIAGTMFRKALEQKAAALPGLVKDAPDDCWSDDIAQKLMAPLKDTVTLWQTRAAKDEKTLKLINDAWAAFTKAVAAA